MSNTFTNRLKLANPAVGDYNWDDEWWRNNFINDIIANDQLSENHVLFGGVISDGGGLNIPYTAGSCKFGSVVYEWAVGTKVGTPGAPSLDFLTNYIYVNSSGVVTISTTPPSGVYLMLGIAEVDQASIDRVVDMRRLFDNSHIIARVEQILLTSATIVDVFVYNTADDSDGGAWRKRCQAKSWYNETLNTVTRGATKEFPAVALIVAEAAKVTIFDATVASCPMWMVFNVAGSSYATCNILYGAISSAIALNGIIAIGATSNIGALRIKFISDLAISQIQVTTYGGVYHGNIGQRNSGLGYNSGVETGYPAIVNATVNDVAMTVLSYAPIDALTGLPAPTIAVATAGGVSVIDGPAGVGTVVDSSSVLAYVGVSIGADRYVYLHRGAAATEVFRTTNTLDTFTADGFTANVRYSYDTIPAISITGQLTSSVCALVAGKVAYGKNDHLTLVREESSQANTMVSWISKDYNTGWMKGDIKRALICEALGVTTGVGATSPDRSVKATTLTANGTLTYSPVAAGADLQAIGPFSAANYLSQAYSADLDFGTGDFCIAGWINTSVVSDYQTIIDRTSASNHRIMVRIDITTGYLFLQLHNGIAAVSLASNYRVAIGTWVFFLAGRRSTKLFIETSIGPFFESAANAHDVSDPDGVLHVGRYVLSNTFPFLGSISLLRIGVGFPSTNQISEMYRTEKELFVDNAKCVLKDSTSTVTALSYDKYSDLLYVGQAAMLNKFSGLRNIESYAASVTKSVSAESDISLIGGTNATVKIPQINIREQLRKKDEIIAKLSSPYKETTTAGAGQTSVTLPIGYYPEQLFDAGLYKAFTVTFDGFAYKANFASSTGATVVRSRRI